MNVTNVFFLEIWFLNLYTQKTYNANTDVKTIFVPRDSRNIFLPFKMK